MGGRRFLTTERFIAFQQQFEIFSIPFIKQLEEEISNRKFQYKRHQWDRGFIQPHTFRRLCKEEQLNAYLEGTSKPELCQPICSVRISRLCKLCGAIRINTYILERDALRNYLHWEESMGSTIVYTYNAQKLGFERERRLKVAAEPPQIFKCPICQEEYPSKPEVEACIKDHNIHRNFELAKKLLLENDEIAFKRLEYTIYRLYRHLDVPPSEIANQLNMKNSEVQYLIGKVFAAQCMKSDTCIFKKILTRR